MCARRDLVPTSTASAALLPQLNKSSRPSPGRNTHEVLITNMAPAQNSLVNIELNRSTSDTTADAPRNETTNETLTPTFETDKYKHTQINPPAHFNQPIDMDNDLIQAPQAARSNGPGAIVPIKNPLTVTPPERLGEEASYIDCPFCKKRTRTEVRHKNSTVTTLAWVICCILTGIGAFIPCLCGWCQDTDHHCSECKNMITHKPHNGTVEVKGPSQPYEIPTIYGYDREGVAMGNSGK